MRIVLHIGMHKAGSSAIQHILWHNREGLRKKGFCYPQPTDRQPGHHEAAWAIRSSAGGKRPTAVGRDVLPKLQRQLRRSDCHTGIISSEEFEFDCHPFDVIAGLDPAIHSVEIQLVGEAEWMPGSVAGHDGCEL